VDAVSHMCPSCGYDGLHEDPWNDDSPSDEICPACGIHFGYDDAAGGNPVNRAEIYVRWRERWIRGGTRWFSAGQKPPAGWDPVKTLARVE
jgi:hypothetical protein